jgi:hypothetical protein
MNLDSVEELEGVDEDVFYDSNLSNWGESPYSALLDAVDALVNHTKSPHDAFQTVWYDYYLYDPTKYLQHMVDLGYDGVVVPQGEGDGAYLPEGQTLVYYVVYNPAVITRVSGKAHDFSRGMKAITL